VGDRVFAILCRDRADEEQINMELAMGWFGDGRRAEKKRDMQSAVRYYKLALEFAPNNPKLTEALARVQ
jgi:tetratricopeptide (TPR) repeat protein